MILTHDQYEQLLGELVAALEAAHPPAHDCDHLVRYSLVPFGNDENHIYVQSCADCAPHAFDDDAACLAVAALVGWNVHRRFDNETRQQWRPFVAKPGGPDDMDHHGVLEPGQDDDGDLEVDVDNGWGYTVEVELTEASA